MRRPAPTVQILRWLSPLLIVAALAGASHGRAAGARTAPEAAWSLPTVSHSEIPLGETPR